MLSLAISLDFTKFCYDVCIKTFEKHHTRPLHTINSHRSSVHCLSNSNIYTSECCNTTSTLLSDANERSANNANYGDFEFNVTYETTTFNRSV